MQNRQSILTVSRISDNIEETPEGFLLCRDVPVARTGEMIYGPGETPVPAGPDGLVRIYRDENAVFDEKTIASALGKSVTNDHPEEDVTSENWKEEEIGIALNVRRGDLDASDLLLMDLLIKDKIGIGLIKSGKREISLGYDADYEYDDEQPGIGYQRNIIINHIALVDQGRCGPRCAIKDKKLLNIGENKMAKKTKKEASRNRGLAKFIDLLFKARKATDEEMSELANEAMDALEEEESVGSNDDFGQEGNGDEEIHVHLDGQEDDDYSENQGSADDDLWAQNAQEHAALWDAINELKAQIGGTADSAEEGEEVFDDGENVEKFIEDELPEGVTKDKAKAKDSAYLIDSYQNVVAQAEILFPGIRVPTCDKADRASLTAKRICGLRKTALDMAYNSVETRTIISEIIGSKTLDTKALSCDAARVIFNSAVAAKKAINNSGAVRDSLSKKTQPTIKKAIQTIAELNEFNRQKYSQK